MAAISPFVNDDESCIIYERSHKEIKDCSKKDFTYEIVNEGSEQRAYFRVKKGSEVVREDVSKPFPAGALTLRSIDVSKTHCKIKVNKADGVSLDDFYD